MPMRVNGLESFIAKANAEIVKAEKEVVETRKKAADIVTEALVSNIPVWSGRTLASVAWTNGAGGPSPRPHPDRGDHSADGPFKRHPEFGRTSRMNLGAEPQRGSAESPIRSSLGSVDYGMKAKLILRSEAPQWDEVDHAQRPDSASARNKAVASEIAQAAAVARVPGVKMK